ncbi:MAG: sulfite exporter TauE/SafE family protein [Methylococcaceae bacterium]|nr:MAG: sulfite exporter TauE/SafE family protein [Methylococcaceae bacterium]
MSDYYEQLLVFGASLVANTFSALAGGGAGLIQFPVLIFLGLSFSVALATHKIASVALGVGASVRYLKEDVLERRFAFFMAAVGIPAVILGSFTVVHIPDALAKAILGVLTIALGVHSLVNKQLGKQYQPIHRELSGLVKGGIVLFVVGFLNGSIASGTGLFATLVLIAWFGMDYKRAVAYTLVIVGLFWNGSGAFVLAMIATVKWSWLPVLLLGSFVGGYLGAHLAILKGNQWIKRSYEVMTIAVGIKLLCF